MSAWVQKFAHGAAGPTIAIKDCIDIAGLPTRAGCAALADAPPAERHADVVHALQQAGWRIAGKTVMHELAYGMSGINGWSGTPRNPQDPALIPGGSSSGSAAAVGFAEVDAALGSDTGGSIRLPAACCGVIGLKPSFGRVSRRGAWPRASSLDCVGPMARDMLMLTRVMAAIAPGFDTRAAAAPMDGAVIGLVATASDQPIQAALAAALGAAGWAVQARTLRGMQAAFEAALSVINQETHDAFGHLAGDARLGADVAQRLALAAQTTPAERALAEAVRARFSAEVDRALDGVDALLLPTLPSLPPTLAQVAAGQPVVGLSALVRPFNLSGHPALSYPVAVPGRPDLKAGLQLIGRRGDDERVCALALHLEQALRRPEHSFLPYWSIT